MREYKTRERQDQEEKRIRIRLARICSGSLRSSRSDIKAKKKQVRPFEESRWDERSAQAYQGGKE